MVAVSLPGAAYSRAAGDPVLHGALLAAGDSHDPATAAKARQLAGGPVDVLFIDADHDYAAVAADWQMYSPLVRPGGLAVFHDICGEPGVRQFWAQLGATADCAEIITSPAHWGGFGVLTVEEAVVAEQKEPQAKAAAAPAPVLLPAGASTDPHVHQVLAERQIAVLNGDEAAIAAADAKLAALGVA